MVRDAVATSLTETAVAMGEMVEKLYGPKWQAQSDLARLLISLSSAILALTVTFRDEIAVTRVYGVSGYALVVVWISMILGLAAAVVAAWLAVNRRTYPIRLQNLAAIQDRKVYEAVKGGDDPAETLRDDLKGIVAVMNRFDRWSSRFLALSLILFILGVLAILVAGWPGQA